jgi:hypothetical protein
MLVDLGRNDVGRISGPGEVRVTDQMMIERYSHVMHIVSNVEGKLAAGSDALDVLRATFPAGTLSGAPKVRAMQIIEELEPERRGVYGGAVGYIGFDGNMDVAIAIRTVVARDGSLLLQAGGRGRRRGLGSRVRMARDRQQGEGRLGGPVGRRFGRKTRLTKSSPKPLTAPRGGARRCVR